MRAIRTGKIVRGIALGGALWGLGFTAARADVPLNGIKVAYHGGALIQHVKVVPLLYGSTWTGRTTPAYLKSFLQAFFADGRYLANLAQYNAGGYQIGSGTAIDPVIDPTVLPKVDSEHATTGIRFQLTDDQIQAEIKGQFSTGKLPPPDADTLYVLCVQYDTVVIAQGSDSESGFAAYHDYAADGGYAYAVIAPTGDDPTQQVTGLAGVHGPLLNLVLTVGISHELAEAVTDPQLDGWSDDNWGEIADIPVALAGLGLITADQLYLPLPGTPYVVQSVWNNQGRTLSAFAP